MSGDRKRGRNRKASMRARRTASATVVNQSRVDHCVHAALALPPAELELVRAAVRAAVDGPKKTP
jgi:hypothetical protein